MQRGCLQNLWKTVWQFMTWQVKCIPFAEQAVRPFKHPLSFCCHWLVFLGSSAQSCMYSHFILVTNLDKCAKYLYFFVNLCTNNNCSVNIVVMRVSPLWPNSGYSVYLHGEVWLSLYDPGFTMCALVCIFLFVCWGSRALYRVANRGLSKHWTDLIHVAGNRIRCSLSTLSHRKEDFFSDLVFLSFCESCGEIKGYCCRIHSHNLLFCIQSNYWKMKLSV